MGTQVPAGAGFSVFAPALLARRYFMSKDEVNYGPIGGALVVLVLFGTVGYFLGGFFGAFVGAGFAYMAWWLKDTNDTLHEMKRQKEHD